MGSKIESDSTRTCKMLSTPALLGVCVTASVFRKATSSRCVGEDILFILQCLIQNGTQIGITLLNSSAQVNTKELNLSCHIYCVQLYQTFHFIDRDHRKSQSVVPSVKDEVLYRQLLNAIPFLTQCFLLYFPIEQYNHGSPFMP